MGAQKEGKHPIRPINVHPFPARMASDLALEKTKHLNPSSVVLDPMVGSGTVIQAAAQFGHRCTGLDVDPLAVLIAKVATAKLDAARLQRLATGLIDRATKVRIRDVKVPWIDKETATFIRYWFAPRQRRDLTRLAYALYRTYPSSDASAEANAVRLALSRLIITKDHGASLARDVSHSRPHRVIETNDFDVLGEFERSVRRISERVAEVRYDQKPIVRMGDSRVLPWIRDASVDMVMTSPPYLNAIDYMRGHRLSLVWLGYSLSHLRRIRRNSIGAERGLDDENVPEQAARIRKALGDVNCLPSRHQHMIDRYSVDLLLMTRQSSRVLKRNGTAVFVVGNSCLRDVFISNARGLKVAARLSGLDVVEERERELPAENRYLPIPPDDKSALGRRMRTETVLTFTRA